MYVYEPSVYIRPSRKGGLAFVGLIGLITKGHANMVVLGLQTGHAIRIQHVLTEFL